MAEEDPTNEGEEDMDGGKKTWREGERESKISIAPPAYLANGSGGETI